MKIYKYKILLGKQNIGIGMSMEKESCEVFCTKYGYFRAVPINDSELLSIEKKYQSFDKEDWIEFGLMKLKDFKDFINANQK